MKSTPLDRVSEVHRRLGQVWRRELRAFQRWLETTENLLHLAALLILPVLLAFVTWLANVTPFVSFLVYPPLASGTYTLFADPEGKYSSPRTFVGGITLGALSGWIALEASATYWYAVPPEQFQVHAGATALSIFLTGILTWSLSLDEPTAFSAALLALVTGSNEFAYVIGIFVSSAIVAGAFSVWYDRFYERRAQYLFQTVKSDDRVLIPIRHDGDDETALFGAYVAAAHEAGKVVLYETIAPDEAAEASSQAAGADGGRRRSRDSYRFDTGPEADLPTDAVPAETMERLQTIEEFIEDTVDIPCEMVVTQGNPDDPRTVLATAEEVNCDLIVSSYEIEGGELAAPSPYVLGLFRGDVDTIAFHSTERQTSWSQILVMVRRPGELAHAMLDFAQRLAPRPGNVTACTCISDTSQRQRATATLRDLANSFAAPFETRVSVGSVEAYLASHTAEYDLAMIGASTDRGTTSRLLSPPTFERLREVDCDLAIVHRG